VAVGGVAYAAGSSAAKSHAQEQAQNQQIAEMQAQMAQAQPPPAQAYAPPPEPVAPPASPPTMDDKLAQLQRLSELKAAGILTDEEVALQKQRILAS